MPRRTRQTDDTRIWVDDVNSDGKLDILVGDMVPLTSPADGVSEGEFKRRFAEWMKARRDAGDKRRAVTNDGKKRHEAQRHVQELYEQRGEFMKEDRTGFVRLYLRKRMHGDVVISGEALPRPRSRPASGGQGADGSAYE